MESEESVVVVKIPRKKAAIAAAASSSSFDDSVSEAGSDIGSVSSSSIPIPTVIPAPKTLEAEEPLNTTQLTDYVEIEPEYLKFLFGCWVKIVNKESSQYSSGGIVTKLDGDQLYLRTMRSKTHTVVDIPSHYIYAKRSSEHYQAITEIAQERQRLKYERRRLEQERSAILRRHYFYGVRGV